MYFIAHNPEFINKALQIFIVQFRLENERT